MNVSRSGAHVRRLEAALLVALMLAALLPGTAAAAASKLVITSSVPATSMSGQAIAVTVEAQDSTNVKDTGYVGTVAITTSDAAATISPASGTAMVAGSITFSVTLKSFGSQTISISSNPPLTAPAPKTVDVTASRIVFTTQPGGGASATAWAQQPVLELRDETGVKVTSGPSSTLAVVLAIAANPGGGTLSGCTGPAAVAGVVTVTGCKIDKAGQGYTLTATSGSLASATSGQFNITAGAASKLGFVVQPARGVPNVAFAAQPVVAVQDAQGNTVTGDNTTVVAIAASSGSLSCSSGTSRTVVSGLATFSGCSLTAVGVGYTLKATSGSLANATSSAFDVADRLVFATQPSNGTAAVALTTQPVVEVRAGSSAKALNDNGTLVTLSIGSGPAGATLTCSPNQVTAAAGAASFAASSCRLDKAGTYTLVATAPNLTSATSSTFTIVAGPAAKLAFTAQPNAGTSNQAFAIQPVVAIQDAGGNTVTSAPATVVTLAIGTNPASGTLSCTSGNTRTTVNGVATFSGCAINNAGVGYTLTASASSLTSATSTAFNVGAPAAVMTLIRSTGMITVGQTASLSVQFAANGSGRTVFLEWTYAGFPWTAVASGTTNSNGFASLTAAPNRSGYYRVRFDGAPDLTAAFSNVVLVGVRQTIALNPSHSGTLTIAQGRSITFRGTVRPTRPDGVASRVTFRFFERRPGTWVLRSQRRVATDASGVARTTFRFGVRGSWYVMAFAETTPYNAVSRFSQREYFLVR